MGRLVQVGGIHGEEIRGRDPATPADAPHVRVRLNRHKAAAGLPRLALFRDRLHRSFLISSRVEALGSRLCLFVASGDTYDEDGLFAVKTRHERGKMLGKSSLTNEPLERCPVCPRDQASAAAPEQAGARYSRDQSSAAVPEQADTRSRAAEDPSPSTREALCLPAALL